MRFSSKYVNISLFAAKMRFQALFRLWAKYTLFSSVLSATIAFGQDN
ncbi:hypothetical protein SALWKB12_2212 [Snodgrassella communis]|uniref:Uncharacterized protein n=1 Tax=Snodgrassella communis TaxID=2946699 RepID=A0A837B1M9_9NEIS|nr:hypothetical protein SALWKB12_2212 [Snodgrassella communis]KDN13882.1 hypothetical protein SALWKB29_2076 [Snodgrassella communis]